MQNALVSYALALIKNWWFRSFLLLSAISTGTTFYAAYHPAFLLPRNALLVIALLAALIAPYDVYKTQQDKIQALLLENARLGDSQEKAKATELANLVSELQDNLAKTRQPVTDRFFGGGAYIRPSAESWKAVRNILQLESPLRERLDRVYTQVDRWAGIVDSGTKPGTGSLELNRITVNLRTEIPRILKELNQMQGRDA